MTGYKPPADVSKAAARAVAWIDEGKAGRGFTSTGRNRAHQLAQREDVPEADIAAMKRYFSRHVHDQEAEGFNRGESGYPSPGRVAWDAWGGAAGQRWVAQSRFAEF